MPSRPPRIKRTFAGGWLSDADASIMALIWQLQKPDGLKDGVSNFEAEVIRGVEKIALIEGNSVEELRHALDQRFGQPGSAANGTEPPAAPPAPEFKDPPAP